MNAEDAKEWLLAAFIVSNNEPNDMIHWALKEIAKTFHKICGRFSA